MHPSVRLHVCRIVPGPWHTALPRIQLQYHSRGMASFFSCSLFFECLLKAPSGSAGGNSTAVVWPQMCLGMKRKGGTCTAPALTLGSMIFHPLALSCWSSANFMLTSSMESCSRSQKPARSWKVGTGNALGSCGDSEGPRWSHYMPRTPAVLAVGHHPRVVFTHHILLAESVKLLHLLGHEELSTAHSAADLLQDWQCWAESRQSYLQQGHRHPLPTIWDPLHRSQPLDPP